MVNYVHLPSPIQSKDNKSMKVRTRLQYNIENKRTVFPPKHFQRVDCWSMQPWHGHGRWGHFNIISELFKVYKVSMLYKIHTFQGMGEKFCVEFQSYYLKFKFHIWYITHTLKEVYLIQGWTFKSSQDLSSCIFLTLLWNFYTLQTLVIQYCYCRLSLMTSCLMTWLCEFIHTKFHNSTLNIINILFMLLAAAWLKPRKYTVNEIKHARNALQIFVHFPLW